MLQIFILTLKSHLLASETETTLASSSQVVLGEVRDLMLTALMATEAPTNTDRAHSGFLLGLIVLGFAPITHQLCLRLNVINCKSSINCCFLVEKNPKHVLRASV